MGVRMSLHTDLFYSVTILFPTSDIFSSNSLGNDAAYIPALTGRDVTSCWQSIWHGDKFHLSQKFQRTDEQDGYSVSSSVAFPAHYIL